MRQFAAGVNRFWLAITGLVLLIGGLTATAMSTGWWLPATAAAGLPINGPQSTSTVSGPDAEAFLSQTTGAVVVLASGIILGVLGLIWLLAQIPRVNAAKPLRLHDNAASGTTVCPPKVLTDAVTAELGAVTGVSAASAVLRGSARRPELTVRVTAHDRTDLQRLLATIHDDVAGHLATALEVPLHRLAVQIDITSTRTSSSSVTV